MSNDFAIIFDVDGTLSETELDGHRVAFNKAFVDFGLDWDWSESLYGELLAVTGGKERIRYYIENWLTDFTVDGVTNDDELAAYIAKIHARKTELFVALLNDGVIGLRIGVERLLRECIENGVRIAIATTTTPANVTGLLTATLGAASIDWFEVIAAGNDAAIKKPDPEIYHYALQHLGLQASQCIAIEDSQNGIRSSLAAGIPTLITVSEYTRKETFKGALSVINHLGEPDMPLQLIAGADIGSSFIDLDALKRIHAEG
ncbi:MAG: HAD-IA family hydrolase [Gammaproteobacteria bacterium]|nr:HAD-IA family hydrolase [Gammaproteobacteria bacterium]